MIYFLIVVLTFITLAFKSALTEEYEMNWTNEEHFAMVFLFILLGSIFWPVVYIYGCILIVTGKQLGSKS